MLSQMRKALFGDDNANEPWKSELDSYKRDVLRLIHSLMQENIGVDALANKEASLTDLGHLAYIGGREVSNQAARILPHLLMMLKDHDSPVSLRNQVLRTLSEICHRNPTAQDIVLHDDVAIQTILDIIADVPRMRESRWALYSLLMMVHDNPDFMTKLQGWRNIKAILEHAANFPQPWTIWGCNTAELLLKLLALKKPGDTGTPSLDPERMLRTPSDGSASLTRAFSTASER